MAVIRCWEQIVCIHHLASALTWLVLKLAPNHMTRYAWRWSRAVEEFCCTYGRMNLGIGPPWGWHISCRACHSGCRVCKDVGKANGYRGCEDATGYRDCGHEGAVTVPWTGFARHGRVKMVRRKAFQTLIVPPGFRVPSGSSKTPDQQRSCSGQRLHPRTAFLHEGAPSVNGLLHGAAALRLMHSTTKAQRLEDVVMQGLLLIHCAHSRRLWCHCACVAACVMCCRPHLQGWRAAIEARGGCSAAGESWQ